MRKLLIAVCAIVCTGVFAAGAQADHFSGYGSQYTIQCNDMHDNDGDGKSDYGDGWMNDVDCASFADNTESGGGGEVLTQCADWWDNDNDGYADFPSDPGCTSGLDNSETADSGGSSGGGGGWPANSGATCDNGYDDDGDGKIDYDGQYGTPDPGCFASYDSDEGNVDQCEDGVDNDADGRVDMGNVFNWNTGQYYPADDGCDAPWDDQEFMEYVPPAGDGTGELDTLWMGSETGSCPDWYSADMCTPFNGMFIAAARSPVQGVTTCTVQPSRTAPVYAAGGVQEIRGRLNISCTRPVSLVKAVAMLARENPTNNTAAIKDVQANTWNLFTFTLANLSVSISVSYMCDQSIPFPANVLWWTSGTVEITAGSPPKTQKAAITSRANYWQCW